MRAYAHKRNSALCPTASFVLITTTVTDYGKLLSFSNTAFCTIIKSLNCSTNQYSSTLSMLHLNIPTQKLS